MKIKKICQICRKGFKVIPARKTAKFCSHKCYAKFRKGKKRLPFSKEWCKKISKSLKGRKGFWKGKKFSKQHRRNIGKGKRGMIPWNKGIPRSEKTKEKIRKTKAMRKIPPWNTGLAHPKKTKNKISKSLYGRFKGSKSPHWKGGKKKIMGYILLYAPDHPFTTKNGFVYEHRLVMEKKLGRYLDPKEVVHHIDSNPSNNHPTNLQLFPNQSKHSQLPRKIT